VNGIAITAAAPQPTQDRRAWTRLARIAVQLEDLAARLPPDMTLEDLEPRALRAAAEDLEAALSALSDRRRP